MIALDSILTDWRACGPHGVVLPPSSLSLVVSRAEARLRAAPAPRALRDLLLPRVASDSAADGVPSDLPRECCTPFARLLCGPADIPGQCVIHFVRFWQAMDVVARAALSPPTTSVEMGDDKEPIACELQTFRDVLLRHHDAGGLTHAWLAEWVTGTRGMSADESAWAPLEESINQVIAATASAQTARASAATSLVEARSMELDEASALMMAWLRELVEDYRRGNRAVQLRRLRDVSGCKLRDACLHLSRSDWDVELALQGFYGGDTSGGKATATVAGKAWSSRGARLRGGELDCPICLEPFDASTCAQKRMITHCCFQVLCSSCHRRLVDSRGRLSCPFCRALTQVPSAGSDETAGPSIVGAIRAASVRAHRGLSAVLAQAHDSPASSESLERAQRQPLEAAARRSSSRQGSSRAAVAASGARRSMGPCGGESCFEAFKGMVPACFLCLGYLVCSAAIGSLGGR